MTMLFDEPEPPVIEDRNKALDDIFDFVEPTVGYRVASTSETRARYSFLKSKKLGSVWEQDGRLYRMGPGGVTVFKPECFG